jgi:hypothetical protein
VPEDIPKDIYSIRPAALIEEMKKEVPFWKKKAEVAPVEKSELLQKLNALNDPPQYFRTQTERRDGLIH